MNGETQRHRIIEYPELEGTHKDQRVQHLAPHRTTPSPNPMSESSVQMFHELQQLEAVPTDCPGSPFHAHCRLVQTLSLTPSCSSPDTAPCRSLGPSQSQSAELSAAIHSPHEGLQAARRPPLSLLGWTNQGNSPTPHMSCPPDLPPSF